MSEAPLRAQRDQPQCEQGGDVLCPLSDFYRDAARTLPAVEHLRAAQLPAPYRALLDHREDMTSTLTRFHKREIVLRALRLERQGDTLTRQVILLTQDSSRPVEFGAIVIHLNALPEAARADVLEGHKPLGGILQDHAVAYVSRPSAFFRIRADEMIASALEIALATPLYGRCNTLRTTRLRLIATVVEILPPLSATHFREEPHEA